MRKRGPLWGVRFSWEAFRELSECKGEPLTAYPGEGTTSLSDPPSAAEQL